MLIIIAQGAILLQVKKKALQRKVVRTRDLEASRKEILSAAFLLVFARGFQGVSVDDIVEKTKLTKGAFYHQFPSKLDLGYALVEEVISPMIIERWIQPLESFENPISGILQQLKRNIGDVESADLKRGCPLNNLVQEMAPVDPGFGKRLNTALNLWIGELEKHLERGKKAGLIKSSVRPRDVANFVVMAHEGFYGMIKGVDDPQLFNSLYRSLRLYFDSIVVKREYTK